jgi:NADH:ubiquinone oxidoreductase subunit 3 (subunit A)
MMAQEYNDIAVVCAVLVVIGCVWLFVANVLEDRRGKRRGKWEGK